MNTPRKIPYEKGIPDLRSVDDQSFNALRWWRSTRADNFHAPALSQMKAAVANVAMLAEPRWREAASGDAAAAIAIVLAMGVQNSHALKFDICMTALVVCACEGDAASCLVVAWVLRRLPKATAREKRLATSWSVRAIRPFLARAGLET
ncbi:hypothetical protein I6F21_29760 [Bradyrhizobium sp. NBAIM03]|uniref:hypothetical protein n=1 Tax=Bradyrhizobium sp. NBAIM03 TaxID=2793816 RepID=UPI001CD6FBE7|nr:hypothetical protein [Bradyrhizobium sp. NBAIM03]MCA1536716.1 hypothetical protein [Bradyrhizobium sp. NBAIM03]